MVPVSGLTRHFTQVASYLLLASAKCCNGTFDDVPDTAFTVNVIQMSVNIIMTHIQHELTLKVKYNKLYKFIYENNYNHFTCSLN